MSTAGAMFRPAERRPGDAEAWAQLRQRALEAEASSVAYAERARALARFVELEGEGRFAAAAAAAELLAVRVDAGLCEVSGVRIVPHDASTCGDGLWDVRADGGLRATADARLALPSCEAAIAAVEARFHGMGLTGRSWCEFARGLSSPPSAASAAGFLSHLQAWRCAVADSAAEWVLVVPSGCRLQRAPDGEAWSWEDVWNVASGEVARLAAAGETWDAIRLAEASELPHFGPFCSWSGGSEAYCLSAGAASRLLESELGGLLPHRPAGDVLAALARRDDPHEAFYEWVLQTAPRPWRARSLPCGVERREADAAADRRDYELVC